MGDPLCTSMRNAVLTNGPIPNTVITVTDVIGIRKDCYVEIY